MHYSYRSIGARWLIQVRACILRQFYLHARSTLQAVHPILRDVSKHTKSLVI